MILFLSNGAGEDAIAAQIASRLLALRPDLRILAMPLLGAGAAYPDQVERVGVLAPPPSLGLSNESWRLWWQDLRHGLVARVWGQMISLRGLTRPGCTLVAVGDLLPVALAGLAGAGRCVFVGTAKSSHHHPYSWLERALLRRWTGQIFVRDELTARELAAHGLAASWVGNAMMDELVPTGLTLPLDFPGLALLPGSRSATYTELPRLLEIYRQLNGQVACQALVALAEGLDLNRLVEHCSGWTYLASGASIGPGGEHTGLVGQLTRPGLAPVLLVRRALGDLLAAATVCLGQAGTANEQAAGAGVPVVALHGGQKLGWYRGRQKGLLGEALEVVAAEQAVATLVRLFRDPELRARRAATGRVRMGPPGGSQRMAAWLAEQVGS